jgi:hypothetical protein
VNPGSGTGISVQRFSSTVIPVLEKSARIANPFKILEEKCYVPYLEWNKMEQNFKFRFQTLTKDFAVKMVKIPVLFYDEFCRYTIFCDILYLTALLLTNLGPRARLHILNFKIKNP